MKKFDQLYSQMNAIREYIPSYDDSRVMSSALSADFNRLFELAWKAMKEYMYKELLITESLQTGSPKEIIRLAFQNSIIDDCEGWLKMASARNNSVHHYSEIEAIMYCDEIINHYLELIEALIAKLNSVLTISDNAVNLSDMREFCKKYSIKISELCMAIMQTYHIDKLDAVKKFNAMSLDERMQLLS